MVRGRMSQDRSDLRSALDFFFNSTSFHKVALEGVPY